MNLQEYDHKLAGLDWYYAWSDDHSVFVAGDSAYQQMLDISKTTQQHGDLFTAWAKFHFTGESFSLPVFSRDDLNRVRDSLLGTKDAKPVVYFTGKPEFHQAADPDGEPLVYAKVNAINHPRLGDTVVRTSMILTTPMDHGFETMNTIYKAVDDPNIGE